MAPPRPRCSASPALPPALPPPLTPATSSATAGGGSQQDHSRKTTPSPTTATTSSSTTAEPLVERDTNGISDAYVFDTHTGEPHLLSSGTDPSPSYFLDASADGRDAFIATKQPLLGWDTDGSRDVYDVRIGGGFPEPAPVIAPCNGDGCKPGASPPPPASPQASATVEGPGNRKPPPPHCTRGKVRKNGKCVKKKQPRKHHTKRAKRTGRNGGRSK